MVKCFTDLWLSRLSTAHLWKSRAQKFEKSGAKTGILITKSRDSRDILPIFIKTLKRTDQVNILKTKSSLTILKWTRNLNTKLERMSIVNKIAYKTIGPHQANLVLSPMRAAKVQASLRICAVSPEPPLLAHTSSESRGTFRQNARSLAPLNGWACAVKICGDGMLEDTNSLDGAQLVFSWQLTNESSLSFFNLKLSPFELKQ